MSYQNWDEMLYTQEEIKNLYEVSKGFCDDINRNHRVRAQEERFFAFIDAGSDALLQEQPELVEALL